MLEKLIIGNESEVEPEAGVLELHAVGSLVESSSGINRVALDNRKVILEPVDFIFPQALPLIDALLRVHIDFSLLFARRFLQSEKKIRKG